MKKYSMIHIPVMSLFSKELYYDVALNWKGTNFLYLFLLLFICLIPSVMRINRGVKGFMQHEAPKFTSQIPDMVFKEGQVFVDVNQPYVITNPANDKAAIIIDTTGTVTSLEGTEAVGLVTKHEAVFQRNAYETRTISFKELPDEFVLNEERMTGWANTIAKYTAITLFPFMLLGSFVFRILQALVYAAIGLAFASMCKSERSYGSLVRLAIVAVTPCILGKTILALAGVHVPLSGLLFFVLALGYLFFGVKACSGVTVVPEGLAVNEPNQNGSHINPYD